MSRGIMERTPEGLDTHLLDGKPLDAANDPVIGGVRPATGWDPFEIWRTRVRGLRRHLPREGKDKTD